MTKNVSSPGSALLHAAELPALARAEARRLAERCGETSVAYPQVEGLHQPFEAQVGRTPDAVAA